MRDVMSSMIRSKWRRPLLLFVVPILLFSCQDPIEDYYEKPEWLSGTVWQLLEERGNYSLFLQGVEATGYRPYLDGKGVVTVMAPDDEAFSAYLSARNYASVSDIPMDELKKIVGFHLLYYAYNKAKLEDFRPEGEGAYDEGIEVLNPGMYYKFRTRSSSVPTEAADPVTGKKVTIYHLERFLPVYSHNFFRSKRIDAKTNYEYFYPNSTWTGGQGFNVSEATVNDYALIASNGYVYTIDKVLHPLETIYDELQKSGKYTDFLALYDRYSQYVYDEDLSNDYGDAVGVDSLYLHEHHLPLAPIALEWPVASYLSMSILSYYSYSVFAPTNKALNDLFDSYWKGNGYPTINDVDHLAIKTLLYECSHLGSVVFPEEITKGTVVSSSSGEPYLFDPQLAVDRKMCVNGSLYGFDQMQAPPRFTAVSGVAFQKRNYSYFMYAMDGGGMLPALASNQKYTLLVPDNATFYTSGYALATSTSTNENFLGTVSGTEWTAAGRTALKDIVEVHTMVGGGELETTGTKVYPNMVPYNYWYVKDGKITSSARFNEQLDPSRNVEPFVPFAELTNNGQPWRNGKVYTYGNSPEGIFNSGADIYATGLQGQFTVINDFRYPHCVFIRLLKAADMIANNKVVGVSGRFAAFIPTNDVLEKALNAGKIPGLRVTYIDIASGMFMVTVTDREVLRAYLLNYFVNATQMTTYPYLGSPVQTGEYVSNNQASPVYYTDNGSTLSIRLGEDGADCMVSPQYDYLPFAYSDGCFHLIESVF